MKFENIRGVSRKNRTRFQLRFQDLSNSKNHTSLHVSLSAYLDPATKYVNTSDLFAWTQMIEDVFDYHFVVAKRLA
jgi:hypothetical protein